MDKFGDLFSLSAQKMLKHWQKKYYQNQDNNLILIF